MEDILLEVEVRRRLASLAAQVGSARLRRRFRLRLRPVTNLFSVYYGLYSSPFFPSSSQGKLTAAASTYIKRKREKEETEGSLELNERAKARDQREASLCSFSLFF